MCSDFSWMLEWVGVAIYLYHAHIAELLQCRLGSSFHFSTAFVSPLTTTTTIIEASQFVLVFFSYLHFFLYRAMKNEKYLMNETLFSPQKNKSNQRYFVAVLRVAQSKRAHSWNREYVERKEEVKKVKRSRLPQQIWIFFISYSLNSLSFRAGNLFFCIVLTHFDEFRQSHDDWRFKFSLRFDSTFSMIVTRSSRLTWNGMHAVQFEDIKAPPNEWIFVVCVNSETSHKLFHIDSRLLVVCVVRVDQQHQKLGCYLIYAKWRKLCQRRIRRFLAISDVSLGKLNFSICTLAPWMFDCWQIKIISHPSSC